MTDPSGQWVTPPPSPLVTHAYRRPCIVVPSLESEKHCGAPSGEHTALGYEICDECHAALYDATVVAGPAVQVLGVSDVA